MLVKELISRIDTKDTPIFFGSRNFVVDATFLYLVASTLNGIQNAFKWNTVISDFW